MATSLILYNAETKNWLTRGRTTPEMNHILNPSEAERQSMVWKPGVTRRLKRSPIGQERARRITMPLGRFSCEDLGAATRNSQPRLISHVEWRKRICRSEPRRFSRLVVRDDDWTGEEILAVALALDQSLEIDDDHRTLVLSNGRYALVVFRLSDIFPEKSFIWRSTANKCLIALNKLFN